MSYGKQVGDKNRNCERDYCDAIPDRGDSSADFFNIFNHPSFGVRINYMTSPQFGQFTQTLNSWLGGGGQSGGLNPLYQIGGPQPIQLALKLQF